MGSKERKNCHQSKGSEERQEGYGYMRPRDVMNVWTGELSQTVQGGVLMPCTSRSRFSIYYPVLFVYVIKSRSTHFVDETLGRGHYPRCERGT